MTEIKDPSLRAIKEGGENYSYVHFDFSFAVQVLVVPNTFVESAEGTISLCEPVVGFLGNLGIG